VSDVRPIQDLLHEAKAEVTVEAKDMEECELQVFIFLFLGIICSLHGHLESYLVKHSYSKPRANNQLMALPT
jgi:hypothetical protein